VRPTCQTLGRATTPGPCLSVPRDQARDAAIRFAEVDITRESHQDSADVLRRAMLDAALAAYDDAGLSGLCAEGRWEAAVDAMRTLDLSHIGALTQTTLDVNVGRAAAVIASATLPPPSGGSVAASAGALAAALVQMVAGLTTGRPKYAGVAAEMQGIRQRAAALTAELLTLVVRDAGAVDAVAMAYRLPKATEQERSLRGDAIERAMRSATEAPLGIARAAAAVADLGATVAERGNTNAVADAAVAVLVAESVCRAAALTVRVNVPALRDASIARQLAREADDVAGAAARAAARATAAVERASGGPGGGS
jgi:methenyltetrahydrofolate cyclohydrolase